MIREKYIDRAKRDERFRVLSTQGVRVRKSTTGPCQLHPMYIKDYEGEEKYDSGFGNTVYKMFFKQLYVVEQV